jgi:hypothetical protein
MALLVVHDRHIPAISLKPAGRVVLGDGGRPATVEVDAANRAEAQSATRWFG